MPHWAGLCPATPRYAAALQEWAADNGALLVADEVITLRTAYGGAQQHYNLTPDITAMGKIIGGGFPVGAISEIIMNRGVSASAIDAGSMFRIHMRPDAPANYRESRPNPASAERLKHFHDSVLDCGILLTYSGAGAISTPMSEAEVEQLAAAHKSLAALP